MRKLFLNLVFAIAVCQSGFSQTTDAVSESAKIRGAEFTGGSTAWRKYLERNLNANVPSTVNAPPGIYTVRVQFVVDGDGNISNVEAVSVPPLCKPCGTEAVRVIQSSPKWTPAMEDGKPVTRKRIQTISFRTSSDTLLRTFIPSGPILVRFENISLRDAIQKAASKGKIVFAQFVSDKCDQCNETADMAMKSSALASVVNEKCVPILIDLNSSDRKEFIEIYNPNQSIGTFFISGDEDLLSRFPKTTSRVSDYIAEVDKALAKLTEGRVTMRELDEEWMTNPGNVSAMEMNLQKRLALGWRTDSLLDVYVRRLPADSFKSKRVLAFLATQAPSIFSQANLVMRRDQQLFHQMWGKLPLATRVSINRQIIYRSLGKAIDMKSPGMAAAVATFAANSYGNDTTIAARRDYDWQLLSYSKGVRDTAAAVNRTISYYEKYLMTIDIQELKIRDSINLKKAFDTARSETVEDPNVKGRFITRRNISYVPISSSFAADLTRGAALIYNSSNNPAYLQKALTWAKRARECPYFNDIQNTYAKLLYVTGNKAEAIALEKETIQKLKRVGRSSKVPEAVLTQMEANEKLKDRL